MPDVFLSYSREDQGVARRFAECFEREGLSVWWDQTLRSGEAYDKVTERALREARAVVVLWSRASAESRWVRAEATEADRSDKLVPVMIEPCKRPIMFELTHTADLSGWKGNPDDLAWKGLVSDVRQFVQREASGQPVPAPAPALASRHKPKIAWVALAVAALAIGALLLWMHSRSPVETAVAQTAAATPRTGPVTLAVLPFANLSSDPEQEYFSDGLTEELLNQLAQVKALRVIGRTSSFSFKGKNEDLRVIGQKLGADNLLEGSVRKDGRSLRITAQLIDGRDGTHLWSQTYDRELSGVFSLQEEVAKDVAKALSITLDVGDLPRVQGGTTQVEAYDRYLHARALYQQGGRVQAQQATELLREAVALDPQFSRAWLLLVYALSETLIGVPASAAAPVHSQIAAATERVLELAPESWWSHALRANEFLSRRQWAQAESAVNAARAAAANSSAEFEADGVQSQFLSRVGRAAENARLLEQSRRRNPLSLFVSTESQIWLDATGQPALAQAEYERSKELTGTHQRANIFALMRLLASGDSGPAAVNAGIRTILDDEGLVMPLTHALDGKAGQPEQVRAAIRQAIDDPANQDFVRMTVVAMYADGFGEKDLALTALRRSAVDFDAEAAVWLPYRSGLRADPRFKEIIREMGLADYFRSSGNWGDFCRPLGEADFECR